MSEREKPLLKRTLEAVTAGGGLVGILAVVVNAPILAVNAFVVAGSAFFAKELAYRN
jgi:hypothetical protein